MRVKFTSGGPPFLRERRRFPLTCGRSCGSCVVYRHRPENKKWRYRMKKLQIMAWVLSALLLTGCGGSGTPTNTDNLPQTSATDASETTTTQNGNEYALEEATPGQDEKSGASDAAPGQVSEKDSSAGDEKPAVGKTPARENGASAPSKAGSAGNGASDSAGSSSSKPAGNSPSAPAGSGAAGSAEETPAPQPEEKVFDMDYAGHPTCAANRLQAPQTAAGEAHSLGTQAR